MSGGRFSKDGDYMDSRDYLAFERAQVLSRRQLINQYNPKNTTEIKINPTPKQPAQKQEHNNEKQGFRFALLDELAEITKQKIKMAPSIFPKILNNHQLSDEEKSQQLAYYWDDNKTLQSNLPDDEDLPNKNYAELKGNTPLIEMATHGYIKTLDVFYSFPHRIHVDKKNHEGLTALLAAVYNGHLDCVSRLIQNNTRQQLADVNLTDSFGNSPLMLAIFLDNLACVKTLLKVKPNLEIENKHNVTALDMVVNNQNIELMSLLLMAGARIRNPEAVLTVLLEEKTQNNHTYTCMRALCAQQDELRKSKASTSLLTDERYSQAKAYLKTIERNRPLGTLLSWMFTPTPELKAETHHHLSKAGPK